MAVLVSWTYFGFVSGLLVLSCWFTWVTYRTVYNLFNEHSHKNTSFATITSPESSFDAPPTRARSNTARARSPSRSTMGRSTSRSIAWLSVFTSLLFNILLLLMLVHTMILYIRTGSLNKDPSQERIKKAERNLRTLFTVELACQVLSLILLITLCFERMKLIVEKTALDRLNNLTVRLGRAMICLIVLLFTVGVSLVHFSRRKRSAIFAVPSVLIYFMFSFWVSFRYLVMTKRISDTMNEKHTNQVSKATLRLAVVSTVAVVSTFIRALGSVLVTLMDDGAASFWIGEVVAWLWPLDAAINQFCILCQFKENEGYYFSMFGWIHDLLSKCIFNH